MATLLPSTVLSTCLDGVALVRHDSDVVPFLSECNSSASQEHGRKWIQCLLSEPRLNIS